ncbi:lysine--tRNA ligase [Mycoplasma marinum]|uniref:Lysine--tRNA ligase n=1 Tax=Mycoplasma marinum TaxID=1937190 RepID=A0A4R0XKC3_9MOLU|nr:lysine--tRNA ligase [Mycoplasma marinum]TCG10904.1 lysine--tRNA ligase [Mycoplasma marinum]
MERKFTEQEQIRRNKLNKYEEMGIKPYASKKDFSHTSKTLEEEFSQFSKEELHDKKNIASVTGRIMGTRGPFIIAKDPSGQLQAYIAKKEFPEMAELVKTLDTGDYIWFEGEVMKTNTGALTIRASKLTLLSKSLRPLPEKFHGLQDVEERRRRRYVDLIMSEETRVKFWTRSKIVSTIRNYFDGLGYMEADTPVLQPILGGATAKPFSTHFNALDMEFYLRVATELPLKKLVVGGIERVYEIGRLFRNEGVDATHNPEFTTIEFYEAHSDLKGMMKRTEELFRFIAKVLNKDSLTFGENEINISGEFAKINMAEAVKEKTGIDFKSNITLEQAREFATEHKLKLEDYYSIGHILELFFEEYVESTLIQPTFVYGHPIEISPLAAKNVEDPRFTDRAELFICGKEFANMFTELNDPIDQMQRFESQLAEREAGNDEASEIDYDFIEALEHAMPPAGGCGIGIDRLVMLFTNSQSIRDVLLFPHLKNRV